MPRTPKPSGAALAATVMDEEYDHTYIAAKLAFALGAIVDGYQTGRPKTYARKLLESMADFDTFIAENPAARKRGV